MNRTLPACTFAAALSLAASVLGAQARLQPLAYTIHVRTPAEKAFDVDVVVPTDRRDSIFMMMPVWSPGMYTLQSYSVDYYVKGPVVGLVLDAHIRKTTNGKKSMDDVIRAEYRRWSGKRGFTAQDFAKTASDAAGIDLVPPLHELVASTGEVDYAEMLDYFGLRFSGGDDPKTAWTLQIRPGVSADQTAHLKALLARSEGAKR